MKDPVISRFADACGAIFPLDLRVDLADGGVLAEGTVAMPFSLVGRDDACDVTLTDAEVNPRHAWIQVVNGRAFVVDLGSRTGLSWPGGSTGSGWMDVGVPARIGPFQLHLRSPVSTRPPAFPLAYNPLQSDPDFSRTGPSVTLEFRNGKRAKDRWTVNRLLTLVGRAPECKIRLTSEDIDGYHCGLVLTPVGLWVVDLSGRGVVVNGERMRVSPLRHSAELWVGRFLIGVQYPAVGITPAGSRPGLLTPPNPLPGLPPHVPIAVLQNAPSSVRAVPEDEVELGAAPTPDSESGLPSSHIMADAFRLWANTSGTNGPVSNPILVSGSEPAQASPANSNGSLHTSTPPALLFGDLFSSSNDSTDAVADVLKELGEVNARMFAYFQQSLVLMVQLFGCLRKDQLPAMQRELARIQELNGELAQLQSEVARRAVEVSGPPSSVRTPPPRAASTSHNLPHSEPSSGRNQHADSTALHHWVLDRISTLQVEQQTRWKSIVGMFSGKSAG